MEEFIAEMERRTVVSDETDVLVAGGGTAGVVAAIAAARNGMRVQLIEQFAPVLASRQGLDAIHIGPLPEHLAIINNISARCEELAVEAAITGDPRKVFHAICFDLL